MQSIYWACLLHVVLVLATMAVAFIAACRIAPSAFCAGQKQRRLALGMPMAITFVGTLTVGLLAHFFLERLLFPDVPAAFMAQLSYSHVMLALCAGCIAAMRAGSHRAERALVETAAGLAASLAAPVGTPRGGVQRGFTLFELAIVLLIVGLMTTFVLATARGLINSARHRDVQAKLANIDQALLTYVSVNYRLPCPANGGLAFGAVGAGVEVRSTVAIGALAAGDCGPLSTNQEINGVVPWVTLGITAADITDPWLGQITYRVSSSGNLSLTRDNALKMTDCEPAGTAGLMTLGNGPGVINTCADRPGTCKLANYGNCTSPLNFLVGRGLTINDGVGATLMSPALGTGAAYVLISHSENVSGSFGTAGGAMRGVVGLGPGPSEIVNANGVALLAAYRDAQQSQTVGVFFDDYVSRPSVGNLILRAQLWARPVS